MNRLLKFAWQLIQGIDLLGAYFVYRTRLRGRFEVAPRIIRHRLVLILLAITTLWLGTFMTVRLFSSALLAVFSGVASLSVAYFLLVLSKRRLFHIRMYDAGSARTLQGSCAVFELYLGRDWTQKRKKQGARSLRAACRWLEQQASARGVLLELWHEPEDVLLLPDHSRRIRRFSSRFWRRSKSDTRKSTMDEVLSAIKKTIAERLASLKHQPDNSLVVVHINRRNIGFAMPAHNRLTDTSEIEACVCSCSEPASVYAHEILHLFGARDLYHNVRLAQAGSSVLDDFESQRALAREGLAIFRANFANSIMASGIRDINELEITPLTAHSVGWNQPLSVRVSEARKYERSVRKTIDKIMAAIFDDD